MDKEEKMNSLKFIEVKGIIKIDSGLHIGAGSDEIRIGGIDNPVVKNPITDEPYIPGSSIKGKMRCLLEQVTNRIKINNKGEGVPFYGDDKDILCNMFGNGKADSSYNGGPTRLIFRDCKLKNADSFPQKGLYTESKYENVIDRTKGTTKQGGVRQVERVPAGAEFDFNIVMKVFKNDEVGLMTNLLKLGLKLLEMDCLGGSGSRGYGRVRFEIQNEGFNIEDLKFDDLVAEFTK
jgi:CRISPR-associated protein Csm3